MSLLLKNFERMQRFMILFSRIFYFTICLFQKKLFILEQYCVYRRIFDKDDGVV